MLPEKQKKASLNIIINETKKNTDSILSRVSDLIKLDKWMEKRQETAINNLLKIDEQIRKIIWDAGKINETIFPFIKRKADESNPLYQNSKELEVVIANLLNIGNILSKEDSTVKRISQFIGNINFTFIKNFLIIKDYF